MSSSSSAAKTEGSPLVEKSSEAEGPNKFATFAAIFSLIAIAVTKVQLTSILFSTSGFPTAYSFYSAIVTDVMLIPAFLIWPSQWGIPTKEMFLGPHYALTLIIVFTTFDLAFTNIALNSISISLQQCIAATNPFWTILIETAITRKMQHPIVYGSVFGLVIGAALATVGDVKGFDAGGVIAACVAVLCSASKYAFTHAAFKQFKSQLGALSLLFWVDLLMLPIFIPWVLISGELVDLLESGMSAGAWWQFTGTAALGGVRALTQYLVLKLVTATSMSTANIFTMVLNIILNFIIPHEHVPEPSVTLFMGIGLVVFFSALYTWFKADKNACFGIMNTKKADDPQSEPLAKA